VLQGARGVLAPAEHAISARRFGCKAGTIGCGLMFDFGQVLGLKRVKGLT